jgi:Kef-type K+ transport system membrane component KefB
MKNKRLLIIFTIIVVLLLIPFIGMQLSNEVNWTSSDFAIMTVLLTSTGLLFEIVMRNVKTTKKRVILGFTIIFIFLLVWVELAVGIFGTKFAGN